MTKTLIIVFVKNPVLGKCKTRLAKTLGDEVALDIYLQLLEYTREFSMKVNCDRHVYFNNSMDTKKFWPTSKFEHHLQLDGDLGKKMNDAFQQSFKKGYEKVLIIGSDCAEINENDLNDAISILDEKQVVLGPAVDGGYYLIGMRQNFPFLFDNKSWSTDQLFQETLAALDQEEVSYGLLSERSDIDYEEDLLRHGYIDFKIKKKG